MGNKKKRKWYSNEQVMRLSELGVEFYGNDPPSQQTFRNWCTVGLKDSAGGTHHLQHFWIGGVRYTTMEAFERFREEITTI